MTTITESNEAVTLINVFTVEPDQQQKLTDLLIEITEETMMDVPGFVSANIHRSRDGTRVVNYAQWESQEAFEAMFDHHMEAEAVARIEELAEYDAHLYDVISTHETNG